MFLENILYSQAYELLSFWLSTPFLFHVPEKHPLTLHVYRDVNWQIFLGGGGGGVGGEGLKVSD